MPDRLSSISEPARSLLLEHLRALRHDLGKYISFQARAIAASDASGLREALLADLLCTRRGPEGSVDAFSLWQGLAPELRGERELGPGLRVDLRGDETFDALAREMEEIARAIALLREDAVTDLALAETAARAREVARLCTELWSRARAPAGSPRE